MSEYRAKISWKSDAPEMFTKNRYSRGHVWEFDEGVTVPASSSPHVVRLPFSNSAAVDPEEALVAAASSCHMLTLLWLAGNDGFRIDSYTDTAVGEMTADENGSQWISKITLDPQIEWAGDKLPSSQEIAELHHNAHKQCYIANSIKADVIIKD
jgi:Predicted redox protein, regulator of disulfide bond formation